MGCTNLKSVTIPNSVTFIGNSVFRNCSSLEAIIIPDNVTRIGGTAFYGCSSLASIVIPDSVTSIGSQAFYGTDWYYDQPAGVVYAGKVAYENKDGFSDNTEIVLKDDTKGIADGAFSMYKSLTSITIPDSVTDIGSCTFYWCDSLASVTIGNSVTSIGERAFDRCSSLMSVKIPNSVTYIGDGAFQDCSSLTSVTISDSVTSIEYFAFFNCENIKKVYFVGNQEEWKDIEIDVGNDSLTNATIYFVESSLKQPEVSISDLGNDTCKVSVKLPDGETPEGAVVYVAGFDENGNIVSLAIKAAEDENLLNLDVDGVANIKVMVIGKNLKPVTRTKKIRYD